MAGCFILVGAFSPACIARLEQNKAGEPNTHLFRESSSCLQSRFCLFPPFRLKCFEPLRLLSNFGEN